MRHALPLYVQISEMLIRDIQAGRLLDGERLPPERDMARQLEISVGTLRKALGDLTEKGMLERRQGSGNYVRAAEDGRSVYAFFRLELLSGGGLPTAEVLSVTRMAKPGHLPDFGRHAEAHRIRRLRRLNDIPAALEEIWLDASYAERLDPEGLSESLYLTYQAGLGLRIQRVEDRVSVGTAPEWGQGVFPVTFGNPTGLVERKSWDQDGQVAEISSTWFDKDKAVYVSRLK